MCCHVKLSKFQYLNWKFLLLITWKNNFKVTLDINFFKGLTAVLFYNKQPGLFALNL